jgi:hypothetical protein
MSEQPGWAGWVAERHVQESPAERMSRQAWQAAERQERAEAAAEAEAAVEAEAERDARAMRFFQTGLSGHSLGDVLARASAIGDEDAEFETARATMEKIEKRRERRAAIARDQGAQLAAISRAAPGDPLEEAQRRAHRAFRETTRAMLTETTLGRAPRARPPFGAGGVAVRSEPVTCDACIAIGADAQESFMIHHSDPDGQPLSVAPDVPVSVPPDDTDRSAARYRRVISR